MIHFRLILGIVLSLLLMLWLAMFLYRRRTTAGKVLFAVVVVCMVFCIWRFISTYNELFTNLQAKTASLSQSGSILPVVIDVAGIVLTIAVVVLVFVQNFKKQR